MRMGKPATGHVRRSVTLAESAGQWCPLLSPRPEFQPKREARCHAKPSLADAGLASVACGESYPPREQPLEPCSLGCFRNGCSQNDLKFGVPLGVVSRRTLLELSGSQVNRQREFLTERPRLFASPIQFPANRHPPVEPHPTWSHGSPFALPHGLARASPALDSSWQANTFTGTHISRRAPDAKLCTFWDSFLAFVDP